MGLKIKSRKLDVDLEKNIIINCITSTNFLKEIAHILKPEHFQIPYAKTVFKWVYNYYLKYDEAPSRYIQDVYNIEKENLDESESELIEFFLQDISDYYESNANNNLKFPLDKAINYAKLRGLEINAKNTLSFLKLGRIKDAENNHLDYRKVAKITSNWVNPNDVKYAKKAMSAENNNVLVKFPGALGEMMGWLERGWLVSSIGRAKIGKSFFLHELRTLSLYAGLKVVEINLEMKTEQLAKRYYQRITGYGEKEGVYKYPVFDCCRNQEGTCKKLERVNNIPAIDENGFKLSYEKTDKKYKPCTACRGSDDFELATWFEEAVCEKMDSSNVIETIEAHKKMYGDNFRLITYPRFSASSDDVDRDLDLLAFTENFVPDVIIYDYADATKPKESGRDGINRVWMWLAKMATERNTLVCTTSHVNSRRIEGKRKTGSTDISDDTRKLNHIDVMFSHSQSDEERDSGTIRCSIEEHRHKFFNPTKEVRVTRHLDTGQSLLDSEFIKRSEIK